jgi:hypothetical protein
VSRQFIRPLLYPSIMAGAASLLVYCCISIFALLLVMEKMVDEGSLGKIRKYVHHEAKVERSTIAKSVATA